MIIACPACATRYVVPDSAIGTSGRVVRCAKCRHSWFQEPNWPSEPAAAPIPAPQSMPAAPAPPLAPPPPPPSPASARADETLPPFVEEVRRRPELEAAPDRFDDGPSSFAHAPPFRPRRNPARLWTALAAGFAVIALALIGAVYWYGLPDWMPLSRSPFAEAQPDLQLDFPRNRQERRPLPSGTDFFNISGTITNVGRERRAVPDLRIVLRDASRHVVYSAETAPPKPVLAPGESETINNAIIDAPKAATAAEIGWKPR
jgi:predicted Zn finger-like uncharacterized protein